MGILLYARQTTLAAVEGLSIAELDHLHDESSNSIGALLAHIAAVERGYQCVTFEERPPSALEQAAWEPALKLGFDGRRLLRNEPLEHYIRELSEVRRRTLDELAARDDAWLERTLSAAPAMNAHWAWFHVAEDEINHRGQIRWLRARLGRTMSERRRVLIEQATRARRSGRLLDAHRDFLEAVTLSRQAGAPHDLIEALKGLGQIERDLGRGDAARPLYEEAVAICRAEDDPLQLAHTVRHLGDIHQDAGRLDLAEPYYLEALTIYQGHPRTAPLDLANTLRPFAILLESLGKTKPAIELWTEARNVYAALNVREGVAESTERLARLERL